MRILISPAKKMNRQTEGPVYRELPAFLPKTQAIVQTLQAMSYEQLKQLWKCSDAIARQNVQRLEHMDLYHDLTPALLAYEGIQYRYMAPGVFTDAEFAYVQEHLRILSGFYGILRPFDGVSPYRLEMQARLCVDGAPDLYAYWGPELARNLAEQTQCVINLASKEYALAVSRYLPPSVRMVSCVFGQEQGGKIIEKGTMCKMARGELVRRMAQYQITQPEQLKTIPVLQFRYAPEWSEENRYVFLQSSAE